jgi:DNA-binding transcriptional MerR regulator
MSPESQTIDPGVSSEEFLRLSVAAVARRLGIAPGTLRTWDRRYGLGPTGHSSGEHRKYSKADLSRLLYMHKLVISGTSPASAAELALAYKGEDEGFTPASAPSLDSQLVQSFLRAAERLDAGLVEEILRSQTELHGVVPVWSDLLVPALSLMGDEWARSGGGIAAEHMVSEVIKRVFTEKMVVTTPRNAVPVLLACVGEEMHSLAITALAAALAEQRICVQFLGARTPIAAIYEVARRSAPPAIFLWAQQQEFAHFDKSEFPSVRPAPRLILGGPGWSGSEVEGAFIAKDLRDACYEISLALGLAA